MAKDDQQKPWRFKPGQSGNPGGRAKGLERIVRETIAAQKALDPVMGELDGWQAMSKHLYEIAMGEDRDRVPAAKLLYERAYGQAKQKVELAGDVVAGDIDAKRMAPLTVQQLEALAVLDVPSDDDETGDDSGPTAH